MLTDELASAGVRGRLLYTNVSCVLRVRVLPTLATGRLPLGREGLGCEFSASPDGREVASSGSEWSENGAAVAHCREDDVIVEIGGPPPRSVVQNWDGCPPAWTPEAALTIGRGDELVRVPDERPVLTRGDLHRAAARHPTMPDDLRWLRRVQIVDAAWLSERRVALLLEIHFTGRLADIGPEQLVAVFDGRRLAGVHVPFDEVTRLEASPSGTYVAVEPDRVLRSDGSRLELPVGGVRAIAWSPDERWAALGTRASIVLVRTAEVERFDAGHRPPRLHRLPLSARDLAWR